MTERIDFALEPGVVLFAILFFVLVNVLLAAVLYPYLRSETSNAEQKGDETGVPAHKGMTEEVMVANEPMDERVDQFLEEIHSG